MVCHSYVFSSLLEDGKRWKWSSNQMIGFDLESLQCVKMSTGETPQYDYWCTSENMNVL